MATAADEAGRAIVVESAYGQRVKVREVMRRITGFSTPVGALYWTPPPSQTAMAKKMLLYLEDRRVLTHHGWAITHAVEEPAHCVASVLEIRQTLTQLLADPDIGDELTAHARAMRAACRRFLDSVGPDHAHPFVPGPWQTVTFGEALGELRATFGIQVGLIATRYRLELEEPLASILPTPDVEERALDGRDNDH